jgi:hypothetical protein
MELTYDNMVAFMQEYFPVFSNLGQDPATVHRMEEFFAPDIVFTGYMGFPEGLLVYPDRQTFLDFDVSHPWAFERLTPLDLTVDERRGVVFALMKFEFVERKTGKVLVEELATGQYHLALDDAGTIKIKKLIFFPQRLAPGVRPGSDVFNTVPPEFAGR